MKILVIGMGAVGGYYGGCLAKAGFDVSFIVKHQASQIQKQGLHIESVQESFSVKSLSVYAWDEQIPLADVIFIAVKTNENNRLASLLKNISHDATIFVLLQNGLTVEADLAGYFPKNLIIGGLCFLCCQKVAPGHIQHLDFGKIKLAPYLAGKTWDAVCPEILQIQKLLIDAGINAIVERNLNHARWEKLVWNIPFNGLSVVLNTTTKPLITELSSRDLIRALMQEVIFAAQSVNVVLADNLIETQLVATEKMIDYAPSMRLDFLAKREMELAQIYVKPLAVASLNGFNMQLTKMLLQELTFIQQQYLSHR